MSADTVNRSAPPDGRNARAQRTRDAVIGALQGLVLEGEPQPNARQIADRAGVSLRSVYVHFASLEDLHRALADRATQLVIGMLSPIDPDDPLADRITELCRQRARVNEEVGPLRRAAALRAGSAPALGEARTFAQAASRDQVARVFGRELEPLDRAARRRRIASVDAAISGESWDLARTTHRLSVDDARTSVVEALTLLLDHSGPPTRGAVGT